MVYAGPWGPATLTRWQELASPAICIHVGTTWRRPSFSATIGRKSVSLARGGLQRIPPTRVDVAGNMCFAGCWNGPTAQHGVFPCRCRQKFGSAGKIPVKTATLVMRIRRLMIWPTAQHSGVREIGRKPTSLARESRQYAGENRLHPYYVHLGWWNGWRHNMVVSVRSVSTGKKQQSHWCSY